MAESLFYGRLRGRQLRNLLNVDAFYERLLSYPSYFRRVFVNMVSRRNEDGG